jgi:hypothetical protein
MTRPNWIIEYLARLDDNNKVVFEKGPMTYTPGKLLENQALDIVNVSELLSNLEKKDSAAREMMKELLKDITKGLAPEVDPKEEFMKFIAESQHDPEASEDRLISSISEENSKIIDDIMKELVEDMEELGKEDTQELVSIDPDFVSKPVTLTRDIISTLEKFKDSMKVIFPEPKPDAGKGKKNEYEDKMKVIYDMLKGVEDLLFQQGQLSTDLECTFTRKSDGSFNIVAKNALVSGLILRPFGSEVQEYKGNNEKAIMPMHVTIFTTKFAEVQDKLDAKSDNSHSVINSFQSPFNTSPRPGGGQGGKGA